MDVREDEDIGHHHADYPSSIKKWAFDKVIQIYGTQDRYKIVDYSLYDMIKYNISSIEKLVLYIEEKDMTDKIRNELKDRESYHKLITDKNINNKKKKEDMYDLFIHNEFDLIGIDPPIKVSSLQLLELRKLYLEYDIKELINIISEVMLIKRFKNVDKLIEYKQKKRDKEHHDFITKAIHENLNVFNKHYSSLLYIAADCFNKNDKENGCRILKVILGDVENG